MKIKELVNNKELWDSFCEELDVLIKVSHRNLEQYTDPSDLYREQGKVYAYKKLLKLRDDVNGRR